MSAPWKLTISLSASKYFEYTPGQAPTNTAYQYRLRRLIFATVNTPVMCKHYCSHLPFSVFGKSDLPYEIETVNTSIFIQ